MKDEDERESVHTHTRAIIGEAKRAIELHPPFHSPHEGYAIIKEELDELWDEVKKCKSIEDRPENLKMEAVQLGAMVLRFLVDLF